MLIGLIPLDERPVNTRYPAMIAAIGGARLALPPPELLSALRRPADTAGLADWLTRQAPQLDGLIVSCEMLGYGSLIASRISDEPAGAILGRLELLRQIRRQQPGLPIYGFNLITRVSNANDQTEEPLGWASYGERMYQISQLLDRQLRGQPVAAALDPLLAEVPAAFRDSVLRRRLRNHAVSLGIMQLLGEGVFDLLVLSSDDTSPDGLPSREKRWLAEWAALLGLGERLLSYPGADEVGCVLLARLLMQRAGLTPRFAPSYAPPEAASNVAAYEDGPIQVTVERQIHALGGQIDPAGTLLAINAPLARRAEWEPAFAAHERTSREAALIALIERVAQRLAQGQPAALADVAYPNGADPALIALMQAHLPLPQLAAYGGWNTAGNTIGVVLAQAAATQLIASPAQRAAHERFLLHRLLEDWGYQQVVRRATRDWLVQRFGAREPDATSMAQTVAQIALQLDALIDQLPGFAGRYRLTPGSLRLPWQRLFEVDFDLDLM